MQTKGPAVDVAAGKNPKQESGIESEAQKKAAALAKADVAKKSEGLAKEEIAKKAEALAKAEIAKKAEALAKDELMKKTLATDALAKAEALRKAEEEALKVTILKADSSEAKRIKPVGLVRDKEEESTGWKASDIAKKFQKTKSGILSPPSKSHTLRVWVEVHIVNQCTLCI